jgi:hypothetical protein
VRKERNLKLTSRITQATRYHFWYNALHLHWRLCALILEASIQTQRSGGILRILHCSEPGGERGASFTAVSSHFPPEATMSIRSLLYGRITELVVLLEAHLYSFSRASASSVLSCP